MSLRDYQRAGETVEFDADEVRAYLDGKGYVIGPGGVGTFLDGKITADIDPNVPEEVWLADLDAYHPAPDKLRAARAQLITASRAIKQKPPAQWTENEKTIMAIITYLKQDG